MLVVDRVTGRVRRVEGVDVTVPAPRGAGSVTGLGGAVGAGGGGRGRHRPPTRPAVVSAPRLVRTVRCAPRRPMPLSLLLVLAIAAAAAVIGLAFMANSGTASVPASTTVVRVQPGQTLWDIAERSAPGSDTEAVVSRIRELNGLGEVALRPGQPLTVPTG
jgi:hypothetical protein